MPFICPKKGTDEHCFGCDHFEICAENYDDYMGYDPESEVDELL